MPPAESTVGKEVVLVGKEEQTVPEGYAVVYTAYITLKNGKRLYAASCGLKAFRLIVRR